jgi:drug/metabolite transporter (DMT)-like permease
MATRRVGAPLALLSMQTIGVAVLAAFLALTGRWPALDASIIPASAVLALAGLIPLALLYRAFALGPIAIISPIVASYAALSVVGIVIFLGERLTLGQAAAIGVTFVGVVIASTDIREVRGILGRRDASESRERRGMPLGVRLGVLATIGFGIWGVLVSAASRTFDAFALVLVWRLCGIAMVAAFLLWRRSALAPLLNTRALSLVTVVGVLDTAANLLLMIGIASGFASFVMTGSGAYPLIPAVLAILVLRERLAPNQYFGVGVLIAGLVALGLQS